MLAQIQTEQERIITQNLKKAVLIHESHLQQMMGTAIIDFGLVFIRIFDYQHALGSSIDLLGRCHSFYLYI